MPRTAVAASIDQIIAAEVDKVVARIMPTLQRALADARARSGRPAPVARAGRRSRRRPARREITRWVADRRARRVPNFVIAMTGGLDTKKKIVARFGEDAAFERGKPLPGAKAGGGANGAASAPRVVKARPPVVRKAAAR